MARLEAHLQDRPSDPVIALDRLVGIGVGAERDGLGRVALLRQRLPQQLGGVRLGKQPRLEIQPRGQVVKGMGRPRKAIDAANVYIECLVVISFFVVLISEG